GMKEDSPAPAFGDRRNADGPKEQPADHRRKTAGLLDVVNLPLLSSTHRRNVTNPELHLGGGHEQVQAQLARKKGCGELALHAVAGRVEPWCERTQPAFAR